MVILGICSVVSSAVSASATVQYTISLAQPEKHFFHVTMKFDSAQNKTAVQLPAWNALYQIRDFAHRVADLRATNQAGQALSITKLDKQTWQVVGDGSLQIKYDVYWDDPGPFNSQLNSFHAFLNLGEILLYGEARRKEGVEVRLVDIPQNWSVGTSLKGELRGRAAVYSAENYDELVDGPVEIGVFQTIVIQEHPRISAVIHGDGWKPEQFISPLQRICSYEIGLMRGAPFEQYVFIFHVGEAAKGSGGGMEHATSTAIAIASMQAMPGVSAHEFFHLWNVKRIRPQSLEPVDYTREMWTRSLWFAEGVTSTYAAYTLLRSGLWSKEIFFADLGSQITELELRPANRWKSAEEASLDAWLEKYPLYRRSAFSISYYTKGQILGVLLDILIRDATENRNSLDDMMRGLNEEFAKKGKFYAEGDLRSMAEKVSGKSLGDFFVRYVSGAEELPYRDVFTRAGLIVKTTERKAATFGFWPQRTELENMIASDVDPDGAAARAGLREGDILLTLNDVAFPQRSERWLREHAPGESVKLRFRRGAEGSEIRFTLDGSIERTDQVEELAKATEKQKRIRDGLLRGTTVNLRGASASE